MIFNWNELSEKQYLNSNKNLKEFIDECIGCIRVGEICIDILIRNYSDDNKDRFAYSYDFYVANENTGYGYKEKSNIHYDYADGTDLYDLSLSYDNFVEESKKIIIDFITCNNTKRGYSLLEKANKPLLIW